MKLFDFIKKDYGQMRHDNLSLEMLVQKAVTEPAYRAEFYKRLLSDELVVITSKSNLGKGNQILQEGTNVNLVSYPDGKIPVFTSTERIFDKGVIKEEVEYLRMKGENLFGLTKGATFLLNPYSDYGKELLPEEVEKMLSGNIFTDNTKTLTIEKVTEVQIGQPAKYPTDIVNSLKILFANKPTVKAAYLGWIYDPASGEPPHYIFGLDANGDLKSLIQEAGFTAKQFLSSNEFVDFINVDDKGGISEYFLKSVAPFYERSN
jgi:SseB protein C-terminal domain/SseB protein N-terminal domain